MNDIFWLWHEYIQDLIKILLVICWQTEQKDDKSYDIYVGPRNEVMPLIISFSKQAMRTKFFVYWKHRESCAAIWLQMHTKLTFGCCSLKITMPFDSTWQNPDFHIYGMSNFCGDVQCLEQEKKLRHSIDTYPRWDWPQTGLALDVDKERSMTWSQKNLSFDPQEELKSVLLNEQFEKRISNVNYSICSPRKAFLADNDSKRVYKWFCAGPTSFQGWWELSFLWWHRFENKPFQYKSS